MWIVLKNDIFTACKFPASRDGQQNMLPSRRLFGTQESVRAV